MEHENGSTSARLCPGAESPPTFPVGKGAAGEATAELLPLPLRAVSACVAADEQAEGGLEPTARQRPGPGVAPAWPSVGFGAAPLPAGKGLGAGAA